MSQPHPHSAADLAPATVLINIEQNLAPLTRDVDLHGWTVTPTPDHNGLAVSHGEYTVSVMLGAQLAAYVQHGGTAGTKTPA